MWVNKHGAIQPNAPFGGIKQSGVGVEFGEEGLFQNTNVQTVIVNHLASWVTTVSGRRLL